MHPPGTPRLAAFISSNDSFTILRGFGRMHCRILLRLQMELMHLEKELDTLDAMDYNNPLVDYRLRSSNDQQSSARQEELSIKIRLKLLEYGESSIT